MMSRAAMQEKDSRHPPRDRRGARRV